MMAILLDGQPYKSETAKTNSELAKKKNRCTKEFWYWLGYFDGQSSVSDLVDHGKKS